MKKYLLILVTMFLTLSLGLAQADSTSTSTNTNSSDSNSNANAANNQGQQQGQGQQQSSGSSAGNNFNQDFGHNTSTGSDLSRMVGAAIAPALTTTLTETCMGSTSAAVGWSGAGISFGTTRRDSACVRRLDSRELKSIQVPGAHFASKELMCDSSKVRAAFLRAGFPCAEDGGVYIAKRAPRKVIKEPNYKAMNKELNRKLDTMFKDDVQK
jgi:hypothetical protein